MVAKHHMVSFLTLVQQGLSFLKDQPHFMLWYSVFRLKQVKVAEGNRGLNMQRGNSPADCQLQQAACSFQASTQSLDLP